MTGHARTLGKVAALGAWAVTVHTAVNATLLRRPAAGIAVSAERMSILVPARNEAERIRACLEAAVTALPPGAELLVLDDDSQDATASLAAAVLEGIPGCRVLRGRSLPHGWLGKNHACQQLADAADPESTVLVFLDADVVVSTDAFTATVNLLRDSGFDAVSPYPQQLADGLLPRLVQPLLQWSWLSLLPLRLAESSPRPSLTAANGQLLAVDRAAYDRAGGHAAVRTEVIEDVALVRRIKATGGRGGVADGTALAQCRMYATGTDLREGYAKSLAPAFASPAGAAGAMGFLSALYVLPALQTFNRSTRVIGLIGYGGGVAGRVVAARTTGGRSWPDAAAHPLSILSLAALTADSWLRRRGRGVRWKGRPVP